MEEYDTKGTKRTKTPDNDQRKKLKSENDFLSSMLRSVENGNKFRSQNKTQNVIRKADKNYVQILVEEMMNIPIKENGSKSVSDSIMSPASDEETRFQHNPPSGTPDGHLKKLELEIRAGTTTVLPNGKTKFTPGILKPDWDAYYHALKQDKDMKCEYSTQLLYYFEVDNSSNVRINFDESLQKPLSSQMKERVSIDDLELSVVPYACRIALAKESDLPTPENLPEKHKLHRRTIRWSFASKREKNWKIDLTEVHTVIAGETDEKVTYELEFEFDEEVIKICKSSDEVQIKSIATKFWDFAIRFLNHLHKSGGDSHFDQFCKMTKVTEPDVISALREFVVEWIPGLQNDQSGDFPGSMPINLGRKHLSMIGSSKYFVSEKTDGVRAMMLVHPDYDDVILIDRRFDFYMVHYPGLKELYASTGPTLLDGELVMHVPTSKPMYLIFDLLALNGVLLGKELLHKRLEKIGTGVVGPYREAEAARKLPERPFTIMGKLFLDKTQIHKLNASVKTDSYGHRFYVDDRLRHHRTDGFIFTPDEPYRPKTVVNLFKWKYVDELSIDLKMSYNRANHTLHFSCVGERGIEKDYPILLKQDHHNRLLRYMSAQKESSCVVEVCYSAKESVWKFKCIRTDKNKANHIRTITNTMDVIKENLSVKELVSMFSSGQLTPQHQSHRMH